MANARIKVSVDKLIALIETKKAEAIASFDDKAAKAEREREEWRDAVMDALYEAERDPHKLPTLQRNGETHVLVKVAAQRTATPILNTAQFDKDIAMLRLSSDETITIGVDTDLGRRYL